MKKNIRNQTPPKSVMDDLRKQIEQIEAEKDKGPYELYLDLLKKDLEERIEPMYRRRLKELDDA